jgi:putative mRNA 3-end processing factor
MFTYDKGIRITGSSLTLDARVHSEACCITHAHMDHLRSHRHIFATPITIDFIKRRMGKIHATAINFHEPFEYEGLRVTFLPAGHILGSAQVLVEREDKRLLYSGDFKTGVSATAEPIAYASCDELIMECTFGNPRYRFPPREEIVQRLCEWAAQTLDEGNAPVVYGYTLGKAQEAMKILADNGFALCAHGSIMRLLEIYKKVGIAFGNVEPFRASTSLAGRVLILPPNARKTRPVEKIINKKTMYLSGWAIDPGVRLHFGVDAALPLSDHCDFDGLIEYVRRVQPKKIFTTHGPPEFAVHLRSLGYDAKPLKPKAQGELF